MNIETGEPQNQQRQHLKAKTNPSVSLDYLVRLDGISVNTSVRITIHYVPDKLILPPDAFAGYLTNLVVLPEPALENLAAMILGDFNNEVVPRWIRIRLTQDMADGVTHQTLIEDRQPNWHNPELLVQIERF